MKDRIYQHENRFLMKDIDGMDPKEITLERIKGTITQEGTPLNKATLLSDEAANMLGLPSLDPTPDDAFRQLSRRYVAETNADYPNFTGAWRWIKYSDGIAVVEWQGSITLGSGVAWAGGYHHTQATPAPFPFAFVSAPKVVSAIRTGNKLAMWCGGPITPTTFSSVWHDGYSGSYSGGAFDNVYLRFEGMWK